MQYLKYCKNCEAVLSYEDVRRSKVFCNSSCAASFNNKKRSKGIKFCLQCHQQLRNSRSIYCSHMCRGEGKRQETIALWQSGRRSGLSGPDSDVLSTVIRDYILTRDGYTCVRCGWCEVHPLSKVPPVQVHHIDGNYRNTDESNLETLCPNCHSLTENFGARNKGMGRTKRRQTYVGNKQEEQ